MKKIWSDKAWDDYLYWQTQDKKTLKKVNQLVKDIERYLSYQCEFIDILSCKGHYEDV